MEFDVDLEKCEVCSKDLIPNERKDNIIKCALCDNEFHNICVGVTPAIYKFLTTRGCPWPCKTCSPDGRDILSGLVSQVKSLTQKVSDYEVRFQKLEALNRLFSPKIVSNKRSYSHVVVESAVSVGTPSKQPRINKSRA